MLRKYKGFPRNFELHDDRSEKSYPATLPHHNYSDLQANGRYKPTGDTSQRAIQASGRLSPPRDASPCLHYAMATPQRSNSAHTNGRADLALRAFKNNQFKSLKAAARSFDVPITTLRWRAAGVQERRDWRPVNCKLSATEEESLIQLILSMDKHGMPPDRKSVV